MNNTSVRELLKEYPGVINIYIYEENELKEILNISDMNEAFLELSPVSVSYSSNILFLSF